MQRLSNAEKAIVKNCHHLQLDSRCIQPGDCFVACPGLASDGRQYIAAALDKGATVILYDSSDFVLPTDYQKNTNMIGVLHLTQYLGELADWFYDFPSKQLKVIGVTGTNGKTSVTSYIAQAFTLVNQNCGVIGTLGWGFLKGTWHHTQHTTPNVIALHQQLAWFVKQGASYVAMEVSSHALDQNRIAGLRFHTVIFTHLSRDHLDYHGTMENYAAAKRKLFEQSDLVEGIANIDELFGQTLYKDFSEKYHFYGISLKPKTTDIQGYFCEKIIAKSNGFEVTVNTPQGILSFSTPLMGQFNIFNLLVAVVVLSNEFIPLEKIADLLPQIQPVNGRMICLTAKNKPTVIIDYAHTPDALEKALTAIRPQCQGRLFCVFGCGGDRDRGKRPLMGKAAADFADQIILTNDNPRSENPESIIQDILQGIAEKKKYHIELDRRSAIAYAIAAAKLNDIILVAGKGHESLQIIGQKRLPFSDTEVVKNFLLRDT